MTERFRFRGKKNVQDAPFFCYKLNLLMNKLKALKVFLRVSAIIQAGYWSLTHLFFPEFYLKTVGVNDFVPEGISLAFMNIIGVLTLGTAVASWLAARDPLQNKTTLIMLLVIGVGSLTVSISQFMVPGRGHGEIATVATLSIQLFLLIYLYPRKVPTRNSSQ